MFACLILNTCHHTQLNRQQRQTRVLALPLYICPSWMSRIHVHVMFLQECGDELVSAAVQFAHEKKMIDLYGSGHESPPQVYLIIISRSVGLANSRRSSILVSNMSLSSKGNSSQDDAGQSA